MAAQLHLQSVITPSKEETVTEVELSYIEKPIIPETQITIVPLKRVYASNDEVIEIGGYNPHNCVLYAQSRGLTLKNYGAARNYPTNSDVPAIGGFVKTLESVSGHLAYVSAVEGDTITIQESNYRAYNTQRKLKQNDPRIVGFITN
jgi:hypothetical protein